MFNIYVKKHKINPSGGNLKNKKFNSTLNL